MSLDLCLKQLHVVHIKVFHRMQYYTFALVLLRHFPVLQIPVTRYFPRLGTSSPVPNRNSLLTVTVWLKLKSSKPAPLLRYSDRLRSSRVIIKSKLSTVWICLELQATLQKQRQK